MQQSKKGNVAVIAAIAVVVVLTVGVLGWMFMNKGSAPAPQPVAVQPVAPMKQQPTQQKNEADNDKKTTGGVENIFAVYSFGGDANRVPTDIAFFSFDLQAKQAKKLFSIAAVTINGEGRLPGEYQFCRKGQKIYFPYSDHEMGELDLTGVVRTFPLSLQKSGNKDYVGHSYFALSPDCASILVSTLSDTENNIDLIDVRTGTVNKAVSFPKSAYAESKEVVRWSRNNPSIVYLDDYDWDRNGGGGGLYTFDVQSHKLETMLPSLSSEKNFVMDISRDEKMGLIMQNDASSISTRIFGQKGDIARLKLDDSGTRLFSPDSQRFLYEGSICPAKNGKCYSTLSISDIHGKNQKMLPNMKANLWLDNKTIAGVDEKGYSLAIVDVDSGLMQMVYAAPKTGNSGDEVTPGSEMGFLSTTD